MKKQIAAATVIGAMLALVCLLWEQQSFAALHKHPARVPANSLSPFDRQLRRA
ncbi:hypothetical protein AB3X96_39015 [Paraburkholderia sp. BR13439]|uniref:hypothetical protein n=1 Tax=Paraburkholderia sp. BR13439 TaxID=3236996 RepID=UPI0034CFCF56